MKKVETDRKDFFRTKSRRNSEGGFTIIEVLIVLAIAGLILLIVFLAVPALQRNSRNTQRKNDISSLLGAVNEWTSNHQGSLPDPGDADDILDAAQPGYYDSENSGNAVGQVEISEDTSAGQLSDNPEDDRAIIVKGAKCNTDFTDVEDGSIRQIAVLYQIETSGDPTVTCQQS